jgi:transcriptional regulator with XRE-family HTH domain
MIKASQCRAARGLLDWTQQELADAARIGVATVRLFEGEAADTRYATLAVLRRALEVAGVEFTNGDQPGVRLTKAGGAKIRKATGKKR